MSGLRGWEIVERAGRVVRPAAEGHGGVVVADLRAGEVRRDPEEGVGRVVGDRNPVTGSRERPGAEKDEVVRSRAENEVLQLDTRVAGDRRRQLRVAAVRVVLDVGERGCERPRP